ncbi:hypothetical protein MASR2M50_24990 [Thauera sp.]
MIWAPKTGVSSGAAAVCACTAPEINNASVLAIKMRFFMATSLTMVKRSRRAPRATSLDGAPRPDSNLARHGAVFSIGV